MLIPPSRNAIPANDPKERSMNDWQNATTTNDDETIALLHDEIARLEAEISARDEAQVADDLTTTWDALHGYEDLEPFRARIEALGIELAAKEETIELLLEQSRFYEDCAAVQRAEWDELQRWVDEVERRFGSGERDENRHQEELDAERRRAEAIRSHADSGRKAWEIQRRGLEQEISRLRSNIPAATGTAALDPAFVALENEVRGLRERCEELEAETGKNPELGSLRQKLAETLARFDESEVAHRRAGDEWAREKNELVAALAASRGEVAREAQRAAPSEAEQLDPAARSAAVEADERIRAFRQHLQELHVREANERASRGGLSARLSRLWKHQD